MQKVVGVASFRDLGPDDPESLYPHEYVAMAAEKDIVRGTGPGLITPWRAVSPGGVRDHGGARRPSHWDRVCALATASAPSRRPSSLLKNAPTSVRDAREASARHPS